MQELRWTSKGCASYSKTMVGPVQCIIELLAPPTRFCACWSQKSNHLNFLSARPLWIEIFRTRIIFLNTVTSVLGNPVSACNFAIVAGGRVLAHFVLLRIERWMAVCPHAITPLCMPDCKSNGFAHSVDHPFFRESRFHRIHEIFEHSCRFYSKVVLASCSLFLAAAFVCRR